jgi:hypothetical protein
MTEQINSASSGSSFTANSKVPSHLTFSQPPSISNTPRQAPKDNKIITEGPGEILSDSLAAESLKSGGSFADGNAAASSQPAKSTTTNTKDTSNATVLEAAPNAAARGSEGAESASHAGGKTTGTGPTASSAGGGISSLGSSIGGVSVSGGSDGSDSSSGSRGTSSRSGTASTGASKPKGTNITEGGFDSDAPNASFNNDVGGENDPGRVAEQQMANATAKAGASAGGDEGIKGGQGGFENLKETSA